MSGKNAGGSRTASARGIRRPQRCETQAGTYEGREGLINGGSSANKVAVYIR